MKTIKLIDMTLALLPTLHRFGLNYNNFVANVIGYKSFSITTPFIFQAGGKLYESGNINILLDEPVSNSGRLKALIADVAEAEQYLFKVDIQILKNVDRMLYHKERVITSDSIILDHCASWVNLTAECVNCKGRQGIQVWADEGRRRL